MQRDIEDILRFRQDLSPFLVHLTRTTGALFAKRSADANLKLIVAARALRAGPTPVSDARFGLGGFFADKEQIEFFGAICFTETPLAEVHCLLEIAYRQVDLQPYGLVFLKERLASRGVAPVQYINNKRGDKNAVVRALATLAISHPAEAKQLLPLVAIFGEKLTSPNATTKQLGQVDFRWEREWRFPAVNGPLEFDAEDVFAGLCPHERIDEFEALFRPVKFIDPTRNMKWYATKLIDCRQRHDLATSVV